MGGPIPFGMHGAVPLLVLYQATFALADNAAEPFIVGVFAAPDNVPVDHADLSLWQVWSVSSSAK